MKENSLGRVISVLVSPAETFRSIAERPTWLVALVTLMVVGLLSMLVAVPRIDWEESVRADLERSGREVPAEQVETAIELMENFGSTLIWVTTLVSPWIVYPLIAAIFLGLFRVLGSDMNFKTSLAVAVHGYMPWLVATLLSVPVLLARGDVTADELKQGVLLSHLGALAGDAGPALAAFLASVDFFSLWAVALLAIGYSIAAGVSKGRALACVVGVWIVYVAGKVGLTALGQAFGG